jgi:hypothetical protein
VGGQTYTYGYKFFRFDATGLFVGWSVVRQDAVLDSNGDAYVARGGLQMYDPNGNPVGPARCSTTVATRFE